MYETPKEAAKKGADPTESMGFNKSGMPAGMTI